MNMRSTLLGVMVVGINAKDLKGKPDIAVKKYKVVVFIDFCFWHVCPLHSNIPKTNREFWEAKLARNQESPI